MNWDMVVKKMTPHVVKIETPGGYGTGFLSLYNDRKTWCGIATALHVVEQADKWRQPIRIVRNDSTDSVYLNESDRIIFTDWKRDSAVILFQHSEFKLPSEPVKLLPLSSQLSIGSAVGWLGFPNIDPYTLCFFSGNISAHRSTREAYLIDGVAINGVSGGPVLCIDKTEGVQIVGSISAYQANRATGEPLPGLSIAQDVSHFHGVIEEIRSIDDANRKKQELESASKQE